MVRTILRWILDLEEAELMRVFVGVFAGNKSEVSYRGTTTATTTTYLIKI